MSARFVKTTHASNHLKFKTIVQRPRSICMAEAAADKIFLLFVTSLVSYKSPCAEVFLRRIGESPNDISATRRRDRSTRAPIRL